MDNKRVILSDNGLKIFEQLIREEAYGDRVGIVKKYLDDNFMRASYEKIGDDGKYKSIGVFCQLDDNKQPTQKNLFFTDVFDIIQNEFKGISDTEQERDGFLKQVMKDWFDKKITKNNSLSSYDF